MIKALNKSICIKCLCFIHNDVYNLLEYITVKYTILEFILSTKISSRTNRQTLSEGVQQSYPYGAHTLSISCTKSVISCRHAISDSAWGGSCPKISEEHQSMGQRPFFEGRQTFLLKKAPHDFSINYTLKLKKNRGSPISGFVFGLQSYLK